jgi:hypothetical protein
MDMFSHPEAFPQCPKGRLREHSRGIQPCVYGSAVAVLQGLGSWLLKSLVFNLNSKYSAIPGGQCR